MKCEHRHAYDVPARDGRLLGRHCPQCALTAWRECECGGWIWGGEPGRKVCSRRCALARARRKYRTFAGARREARTRREALRLYAVARAGAVRALLRLREQHQRCGDEGDVRGMARVERKIGKVTKASVRALRALAENAQDALEGRSCSPRPKRQRRKPRKGGKR